MSTLKVLFCRLTNTSSWSEAKERYPIHATEEKLNKYMECDLKGNVPKPFQDFCQRVVSSNVTTSAPSGTTYDYTYCHSSTEVEHSSSAIVIVSSYCDVTVKAANPEFCGAIIQLNHEQVNNHFVIFIDS